MVGILLVRYYSGLIGTYNLPFLNSFDSRFVFVGGWGDWNKRYASSDS